MESEKILQEQIKNAPEEIKDLLLNDAWLQTLNNLAQTNNFSEDQTKSLENEVVFVLLGMELLSDFQKNIRENLRLNEEISSMVSDTINKEIFIKVSEILPEKMEEGSEQTPVETKVSENLPEIPPEDLPVVVPGEKVHDTAPQNKTPQTPSAQAPAPSVPVNLPTDSNVPTFEKRPEFNAPQPQEKLVVAEKKEETKPEPAKTPTPTHYPPGLDPYREPIE